MSDRKSLFGKFVWFELVSRDAKNAQAFYGEVLGWKVMPFPMGDVPYEMICTGDTPDTMIGGYAPPESDRVPSHWISYVSVEDVDAAAKAATASVFFRLLPSWADRGAGVAHPELAAHLILRA